MACLGLKRSFGTDSSIDVSTSPSSFRVLHCFKVIDTLLQKIIIENESTNPSMKARVSVFYYTFSTIVFDCPIALYGNARYILNI